MTFPPPGCRGRGERGEGGIPQFKIFFDIFFTNVRRERILDQMFLNWMQYKNHLGFIYLIIRYK